MADSANCLRYSFVVNSMVRGYHKYKDIWPDPIVGEALPCKREVGNPHDPLAVSIIKTIGGEHKIVGHVPRRISPLCSVFIRRSGNIKCIIIGPRRYSSDLPQGGLELPCKFVFSTHDAEESSRLRKLITDSLSKLCYGENPVDGSVEEEFVETVTSKSISTEKEESKVNNQLDESAFDTSEVPTFMAIQKTIINESMSTSQPTVIADEVVCSPARKKHKQFDEEQIVMGAQLTDLEINFAQQLLKQQFKHINGLCSTLLQEKATNFTTNSMANRIQIIHCESRRHWIVATTVNSKHDTVKVYDSLFHYLDKASLQIVKNCFSFENEVPQVKMVQCRKQQGVTDCGVYAIAFAVAIAFGVNPGRQNFNQDMMRAHLVRCFKNKQFSLFPCK